MKKIIISLLFLVLMLPVVVFGKEKTLNIYLFYGDGCPHCAAEEKFFDKYLKEHKDIKIHKYEVWNNEENAQKYLDVHKLLGDRGNGIPYLVIGSNSIPIITNKYFFIITSYYLTGGWIVNSLGIDL